MLPIRFLKAGELPYVLGNDGGSLFVADSDFGGTFPKHFVRLDLRTGRREPWLELSPPDMAGVQRAFGAWVTPNGRFYWYGYLRRLYDLYVIEGLK